MQTLCTLREIIADQLAISSFEIGLLDTFADLGIDSLDHAKLISQCEEHWDIEIPEKEAAACHSVADLHSAIQRASAIQAMATTNQAL